MRTYSIYIIKNRINRKVYIGQTCQNVEERFRQHKKPSTFKLRGTYKIYNAMKKYGVENFYIETLEANIMPEKINEREIYYISKYDSYNNGYNSTPGGDGRNIYEISDIEEFKVMFNDGILFKDIATHFNVCQQTVARTAKALGLSRRKTLNEEYILESAKNKTNIEIAKKLNVCPDTISRILKKYGKLKGKGSANYLSPQNQLRIKEESKEEFAKMWADKTIKVDAIAKHFNINKFELYRYAKRWNLPKRRNIRRTGYETNKKNCRYGLLE